MFKKNGLILDNFSLLSNSINRRGLINNKRLNPPWRIEPFKYCDGKKIARFSKKKNELFFKERTDVSNFHVANGLFLKRTKISFHDYLFTV